MLVWRSAIQFSPDGTLAPERFATFESSTYGGENSLDLRNIDRPDGSYDFLSLSQVLDFVDDDRTAFAELSRIASDCAIVHLAFTSVMTAAVSDHYPEPRGAHGRFHEYGRDVFRHLGAPELGFEAIEVTTTDPCTGVTGPMFLLARSRSDANTLRAAIAATSAAALVN